MAHSLYKLALIAASILMTSAAAYADVSYSGYYVALAFVLAVLLIPVIVVAFTRRTRKKVYLVALIVWAVVAFAYLWMTGARQIEFFIIASAPYAILGLYLMKEERLFPPEN